MADPVLWAQKMAKVLGDTSKSVKDSVLGNDDATAAKVPKGGGTAGGNGAPAGNAPDPAGGQAPTAAPTGGGPAGGGPAGGAPKGGGPAGGGPAGNAPTGGAPTGGAPTGGGAPQGGNTTPGGGGAPAGGGTPTTAPAGNDAKSHSEAAKKSCADVTSIVEAAKADEAELKKLLADAQAGKKAADEGKRQAEAADKSIAPAPQVPKPQGKDPKEQYASAIQIKGQMSKAINDAEGKQSTAKEQAGAAEVGKASVEAAQTGVKKVSQKLNQASEKATSAAESASSSASSAASSAAESKKKADQAAKDKAADKDELLKKSQEDAKHAAAAKDCATKAQAAAKQLAASAKNAETQLQTVDKLAGEAKSAADSAKQMTTNQFAKVEPHHQASLKATIQEQEYKAKLSEEDAEEILRKQYEKLGGDPELTKAMADEDRDFDTLTELFRAELKRWQAQKVKELDDLKTRLEATMKQGDAQIPEAKKWLAKEDTPATEKIKAEVAALGPEKLATEPGKKLSFELNERVSRIARIKERVAFNEKIIEKTKITLDTLKDRYKDVDKQYEAGEAFLKGRRTELDNLLEIDRMTLEMKVDHLQMRPKPVRDRMKKEADTELKRITTLIILEAKADDAEFEAPIEQIQIDPLDWKSIQETTEKLKNAKLEDLKKDDPKLLKIREEYENAGGDPALLAKRLAKWKEDTEANTNLDKERGDTFKSRSEKIRAQIVEAETKLRDAEMNRDGVKGFDASQKSRLDAFEKRDKDPNAQPLTQQDRAEWKLLEREVKRHEDRLKSLDAEVEAAKSARANAEKQLEQERQRHEQLVDDDRDPTPKPTSDEINKMPLEAKYTELTGKAASA